MTKPPLNISSLNLEITGQQADILRLNDVEMAIAHALEIVDRYATTFDPNGTLYNWFMMQKFPGLKCHANLLPEHPTYRNLPWAALTGYGQYLISYSINNDPVP